MQLAKLLTYFRDSPASRLIRAHSTAPFIVDFFSLQFKQARRTMIPHSELVAALRLYLDELHEVHPDVLVGKADAYLNEWREERWLQRSLELGLDEPVFQLTRHAEDVFRILDQVLDRDLGFVGTESRLKLVIETLSDLVVGASDDPEKRLSYLREERARLQAEIQQIETDGRISKFQPAQIRERFSTAVSLLRQLQGDFRAVEDSFRDITAQVRQRQVGGQLSRGNILEFALDAEDVLKQEDQGVSFYEFVRLILSPSQTERLEQVIREVRKIPELVHQQEGLDVVRNMVTLLQHEAEKVMRTNQMLSATLRRLLDVRSHTERQRTARLMRDIQVLAGAYRGDANSNEIGLALDLELTIDSPLRRTFWTEPARFERVDARGFEAGAGERLEAFQEFAALKHLDWNEMRDRIQHMLITEYAPTLGQLLEVHPAQAGVVEVIGYLQIASEDGHLIDADSTENVTIAGAISTGPSLMITIPRVTFVPKGKTAHAP